MVSWQQPISSKHSTSTTNLFFTGFDVLTLIIHTADCNLKQQSCTSGSQNALLELESLNPFSKKKKSVKLSTNTVTCTMRSWVLNSSKASWFCPPTHHALMLGHNKVFEKLHWCKQVLISLILKQFFGGYSSNIVFFIYHA